MRHMSSLMGGDLRAASGTIGSENRTSSATTGATAATGATSGDAKKPSTTEADLSGKSGTTSGEISRHTDNSGTASGSTQNDGGSRTSRSIERFSPRQVRGRNDERDHATAVDERDSQAPLVPLSNLEGGIDDAKGRESANSDAAAGDDNSKGHSASQCPDVEIGVGVGAAAGLEVEDQVVSGPIDRDNSTHEPMC